MPLSRKPVAGAMCLLAFALTPLVAAPATATPPSAAGRAAAVCEGWKNAGSAPLKWSRVSDGCGHFGANGMKMSYAWKVYRGGSICVRAKGFDARRKEFWSAPLCAKNGKIQVAWGNVAASKEILVKGGPSLLRWN
ncbi:hypothetical protein [Streptomyces sp. WAC08241]|uniref:hypothetical protein n=1 Tax=Streptomyces sp. WAC08241 TaxID=2487421 RepID=UPI000F7B6647|nr:hypothetical protein [Streptomyces sp. WAC08241]RSS44383.1 hypothetical protein EF906_07245 [Streptomyces sp. WAC08241]